MTLFVQLLLILSLISGFRSDNNIPPSIRFTLDREESTSPLVYYFTAPEDDQPYPILVLCGGSTRPGEVTSIFGFREYFAEKIRSLRVGYLTLEQWGIDGNRIDEDEFWKHYTRSNRLNDHLRVLHHLQEHPPAGWNGQFIFVGLSEGGPIVTYLSTLFPNTLATVNLVGAGDWAWADEFWQFFEHWKKNSLTHRLYHSIPKWLPFSADLPPTRQEFDALIQSTLANPTPNQLLGGVTYLYHADALQKPPIDYSKIRAPYLAVAGTEDSTILSSDQFVQKARSAGAPITYFRVDGMDHYIRYRPDILDQSFNWLQMQLAN